MYKERKEKKRNGLIEEKIKRKKKEAKEQLRMGKTNFLRERERERERKEKEKRENERERERERERRKR